MHPRPQLTRERWVDLCGTWQFSYDDADVGRTERWAERDDVWRLRIEVPYPPESTLSGVGDPSFHPVVWYRRSVEVHRGAAERWLLHFGAVDYRAEVWVNGLAVTAHEGGHVPFSVDVTDALRDDGSQVVVVRAEDLPTDAEQPRGKQDLREQPHGIFYHRTTGIWQPVWLEPVPRSRVAGVRWVTDVDTGLLRAHVDLLAAPPGSRVRVTVLGHGDVLAEHTWTVTRAAAASGAGLDGDVPVLTGPMREDADRWLWSPEHPNLLDIEVALRGPGGEVVDRVRSYTGFRSVGASAGRFTLNGRPRHLRLVLAQGYWPRSHLAAPSEEALRAEVEWVKALGFNGIRLHQKVEDPRFLSLCDRLGVLVWAELPAAFAWSRKAALRTTREWLAVLERDLSVPCIVAWVPVNESWGVPDLQNDPAQRSFVEALYALARAVDGTRPVVGNDGWEHVVTDLVTIHDYSQDGATLRERYGDHAALDRSLTEVRPYLRPLLLPGVQRGERPVLLTEFGGISYRAGRDFWNGYGAAADEEEFLRRYRDLLGAVHSSTVLAGFCYTQLTDTEQERNGLLTADREPKVDPAVLRAITRPSPAAVPGERLPTHTDG
ncbi:MAG TPA: glycoside hydrolase family 2 TIM barrel-domain containing protein [Dermatophilaceae bacterium]|nr:glycoside hydrolase family 2 TIM barrel-domain containing protein [Dermatophilaceae bacterium]